MRRLACAAALLLVVWTGCGVTPRPRVLGQVDAVRRGSAAKSAQQLAPQAFLHAEQLRKRASTAYEARDLPAAQVLGEHALAAYEHAFVLARLARAEDRLLAAQRELTKTKQQLQEVETQQQQVASEADALELRIKVLRDAEPLRPNEPTTPKRERARRAAARALALQARLLCSATRLLAPRDESLSASFNDLTTLENNLEGGSTPTPIDEAIRLRSRCLELLTEVRRKTTRESPADGTADALLEELSNAGGLFTYRDDRGVVVTLHHVFAPDGGLVPAAAEQIALLGRVGRAHPDFPVLVVVHNASGRTAADAKHAGVVAEVLRANGATRVETHAVGNAQPLVDPHQRTATERNSRVEIVFVAPAS